MTMEVAGSAPARPVPAARWRCVDDLLQRHIAAGHISGAVVAISRHGTLAHRAALGLADPIVGAPMRDDALFQMYSSTKPLTAAAVLILMEEGRLALEDPVSRHLPEFRNAQVAVRRRGGATRGAARGPAEAFDLAPAQRDLTLLDLLTHVGGLASSQPERVTEPPPARAAGETLADHARRLGRQPLDHQPGARWSYSPMAGCDVLAGVVEVVAGLPFDTFLSERILRPLGMTDTGFNVSDAARARLLPVFRRHQDRWERVAPSATGEAAIRAGRNLDSGSMGLVSTAHDYLIWEETLLRKGMAPNGYRLLEPRSVDLMRINHVGDLYTGEGAYPRPIRGHGFGLLVHVVLDQPNAETARANGAFGWGGYLGTTSWTDPAEGIAAVLLIQQNVRDVQLDFERSIRRAISE